MLKNVKLLLAQYGYNFDLEKFKTWCFLNEQGFYSAFVTWPLAKQLSFVNWINAPFDVALPEEFTVSFACIHEGRQLFHKAQVPDVKSVNSYHSQYWPNHILKKVIY